MEMRAGVDDGYCLMSCKDGDLGDTCEITRDTKLKGYITVMGLYN